MKRLVIFSFYDKEGIVDDYVYHLLKELQTIASRLIVVVNGDILSSDKEQLVKKYGTVIQRENKGYDAGAYKDVIFNHLGVEQVKAFDELILCNDTFFGPLVPFSNIWEKFEKNNIDFWGLYFWQAGYVGCVSSFFLVFRKSILSDERFYTYWDENIDENCDDVKEVYGTFEVGLFYELCSMGYKYDVYADESDCHIMKSPDYAIEEHNVPFVKKKIFDSEYYKQENVYKALSYIVRMKLYDIDMICTSAFRKYGWEIDYDYLEKADELYSDEVKSRPTMRKVNDIETLKLFCKTWERETIYIYGAGDVAAKIYFLLRKEIKSFGGFIVSKTNCRHSMFGFPIIEIEQILLEDKCFIVGMNPKNSDEVRQIVSETERVIYIWDR